MDEYERAAGELRNVVITTSLDDYIKIIDPDTSDEDCRSIQTIMNHVIRAGYGYANYIRKQFGDDWTKGKKNYDSNSPENACDELEHMLAYTVRTLENKWDLTHDGVLSNKMKTSWGAEYNFEQLFENQNS